MTTAPRDYEAELSALRAANRQLSLSAAAAQGRASTATAAYQQQSAFLATVAHELRNPLLPIKLATQMLQRARTDDDAFAALQATITGQVADMGRLINDLLDGARVTTGKYRLERTVVDVVSLIHGGAHLHARDRGAPAPSAGHAAPCADPVLGDRLRLVRCSTT
ncbi:hypothetical protein HK414_20725 [Ramlibacter terrae]|uniref:histidine kinase n=1 Tax=Ramlibacter terrae TaxID=2732511 RepID=A0ABX6P4U3_9BURK|nr:hypothetical protein HK414_20725 [Ramlibacter terrae]